MPREFFHDTIRLAVKMKPKNLYLSVHLRCHNYVPPCLIIEKGYVYTSVSQLGHHGTQGCCEPTLGCHGWIISVQPFLKKCEKLRIITTNIKPITMCE